MKAHIDMQQLFDIYFTRRAMCALSTRAGWWFSCGHGMVQPSPPSLSFSASPPGDPPRISGRAPFLPPRSPWRPPICFLSLGIGLFRVFQINGAIGNVGFAYLASFT